MNKGRKTSNFYITKFNFFISKYLFLIEETKNRRKNLIKTIVKKVYMKRKYKNLEKRKHFK